MNIVIVGGGSVGSAICAQLVKEGHDITVIDSDSSSIEELSNKCDVAGVVGNGADVSTLLKAGADKADLLIAVASNDEMNILCCAAARKLGTDHTIARVRNPEYSELIKLMGDEMNLSLTINPEYTAAEEIYRMLRFPSATKIDTFCRGRVEIAEFVLSDDSEFCGKTLNDLRAMLNIRFLVCGVLRDEKAYIPSGAFEMQAGDVICVTASEHDMTSFFKAIGAYKKPTKNIIIVGGGRTTYYLEELLKSSNITSTVIEKDKNLCRELAENFSCTVVCDDGSKQDTLLAEGIEKTDALLALSSGDEENAIVSMYAKSLGVSKIVTMISTISYIDLFKGVGLDTIISPKSSTAATILKYVRSTVNSKDSDIESLYKIMDGRVEALEFSVKSEVEGITNIPLKELHARKDVLIACIVHEGKVIIPSGNDMILCGDTVVIVAASGQMNSIKDILR